MPRKRLLSYRSLRSIIIRSSLYQKLWRNRSKIKICVRFIIFEGKFHGRVGNKGSHRKRRILLMRNFIEKKESQTIRMITAYYKSIIVSLVCEIDNIRDLYIKPILLSFIVLLII